MKDTDNKQQQNLKHRSAGISAGLQLALFFIISFYLLNYPVTLAILLGLTGGVASGLIVTWWHSPHQPPQDIRDPTPSETARYKTRIGQAQHQRAVREVNTPLGSLFKSRPRSSKKRSGRRSHRGKS